MFSFVGETKTIIASMSLNEIKKKNSRNCYCCLNWTKDTKIYIFFNATETVPALRMRIFLHLLKLLIFFPISWNTMLPRMMRTENNKKAHFHAIQTVTV